MIPLGNVVHTAWALAGVAANAAAVMVATLLRTSAFALVVVMNLLLQIMGENSFGELAD